MTGDHELAQRIRLQSQQRYARPCDVVDAMIAHALERSAPLLLPSLPESRVLQRRKRLRKTDRTVHRWFVLKHQALPQRQNQAAKSIVAVGKGLPRREQDQPLSLPLVYEQLEAESVEGHHGQ